MIRKAKYNSEGQFLLKFEHKLNNMKKKVVKILVDMNNNS